MKTKIKTIGVNVVIPAIILASLLSAINLVKPVRALEQEVAPHVEYKDGYVPDPCGLTNVECPNEKPVQTLYVETSAYTYREEETDNSPCISASGDNVCELDARGDRSCAANWLPFGTRINVEGFGICTVRDRMHRRFTSRLDLGFGTEASLASARRWGVRTVKVEILP